MSPAAGTALAAPDLPAVHVAAGAQPAPDGMTVYPLGRVPGASLARFVLPAGRVTHAVKHRQVHEIWTVVEGNGTLWRRLATFEQTDALMPGVALTLAPETCFQVCTAASPLAIVAVTVPAWSGDAEARLVAGRWPVPAARPPAGVTLRDACPADCGRLAALAVRSKAYWGYSEAFLRACAAELAVRPEHLTRTRVAEANGVPLGFCAVGPVVDGTAELEALFVDPPQIGAGLGRRLFEAALALARACGAQRLVIQADPGAAAFYAACGARPCGTRPSGSIPGRSLPLFEIECAAAGASRNGAART